MRGNGPWAMRGWSSAQARWLQRTCVCIRDDSDTHDSDTHDSDTHDSDTHDSDTHDSKILRLYLFEHLW
jgi:hypothetical protein